MVIKEFYMGKGMFNEPYYGTRTNFTSNGKELHSSRIDMGNGFIYAIASDASELARNTGEMIRFNRTVKNPSPFEKGK